VLLVLISFLSPVLASEAPKTAKPFALPTMRGNDVDFQKRPAPFVPAPEIDAELIFDKILACYPTVSKFGIDIALKGALGVGDDYTTAQVTGDQQSDRTVTQDTTGQQIQTTTATQSSNILGRGYIGLVASMPLYSSTELERAKNNERTRRESIATDISMFIAGISTRNQAMREIALYGVLEERASVRVQTGIVEISEQVGHLKELAQSSEKKILADQKILEARLKLAGNCGPETKKPMGEWLKTLAELPKD
jgi:hypothetical protein